MKVGVIKLGGRISFNANDTSGGNGEARSIIKMLHTGGAEVHIFTKILSKDNLVPEYTWYNLEDAILPEFIDALVVINGNVNFFGGAEDRVQLLNYAVINAFDGPVYYCYCDPELTLKQVWPSVQRKPWGKKWSEKDLLIARDDIVYLSQPYDTTRVMNDFRKSEVRPVSVIHFPFEQFPMMNSPAPLPFNPEPQVDLSYGGTMRGGKRLHKMIKFYFGHPREIKVEMFGKIKSEDFDVNGPNGTHSGWLSEPTFTGPIRYDEMLPKMNKSLAHCVIGDPYYEEINDMPQRTYESIMANVVTFIDHDMDKLRRVYGQDQVLADFLYVQDRSELSEKILLLKADINIRRQILDGQLKAVNFDAVKYSRKFVARLDV